MNLRRWFPWYLRIIVKVILSRIPVAYHFWKKIGLFEHGGMQNETYARDVFNKHIHNYKTESANGFTVLELGPGDSVYSALLAWAAGARQIYLLDVGDYVDRDSKALLELANNLRETGAVLPKFEKEDDFATILQRLNTKYLTEGLKDLRKIESDSVDFIWSQAVLEHIRLNEFDDVANELKRVMAVQGIQSHRIDLKDHLGGGLESLRFSKSLWESAWMSGSGFYTNRIRFNGMIQFFNRAGFSVDVTNTDQWAILPIKKSNLDVQFNQLDDKELCISGFDVLLAHK